MGGVENCPKMCYAFIFFSAKSVTGGWGGVENHRKMCYVIFEWPLLYIKINFKKIWKISNFKW